MKAPNCTPFTESKFAIVYRDGAYRVSIPNYDGGEVVPLEVAEAASKDLAEALNRLMPIAAACKFENFGDIYGNEDTKTAALLSARAALKKAGWTA